MQLTKIGEYFGGKKHTTVLHALNKVTDEELYIKTILVSKNYRNKDIETKLYEMVLEVNNRKVRIKSWSTNTDQIKILKKLGFVEEKIIKNDREINVDTIYFVKN